ncbi:MAG: adenylate/guanylate cyclase domain-containing protein [Acidimicrobiales bacterium]
MTEREFKRLDRRIGAAGGFSNLDGAIFVFVYLAFIVPSPGHIEASDYWWTAALAVALFVWCGTLSERWCRQALGWLKENRAPTQAERRATLRLPFTLAVQGFSTWVVAAVVFSANEALFEDTPGLVAVRMFAVILDGGLVSTAVASLLTERALRPIFALALAGRDEDDELPMQLGVRQRLVLTWLLGSGIPLLGLAMLPIANHIPGIERPNLAGAVVALSIVGILVGGLVMLIAAKSVSDPLTGIRRALDQVGQGKLDVEVSVDDSGEIGRLQAGVNDMVAGLRERARLADLFGRHVGQEVAELALAQGTGLESELRDASALFVDLIGSTAMAEMLPPDEVVRTLNAYFGTVVRVAAAEGGWVNKFEGDGALCVFGAPATQPDHAARALRAARQLRGELDALRTQHPGLDAAIGVSAGQVVAGNVGTETRYEYTVIGRPVNEAARLTELAKGREGRIVASAAAMDRAGAEANRWGSLGTVVLRGQQAPAEIYEPKLGAAVRL